MIQNNEYKVLLPMWILRQIRTISREEYLGLVKNYMRRYPHYRLKSVQSYMVVCERIEEPPEKRGKKT